MLSVTPAPDSLAMPTIAEVLFDFTNRPTQTFVRVPRAKAGVPREEPRMPARNDCCKNIVGEVGIREEKKRKR